MAPIENTQFSYSSLSHAIPGHKNIILTMNRNKQKKNQSREKQFVQIIRHCSEKLTLLGECQCFRATILFIKSINHFRRMLHFV